VAPTPVSMSMQRNPVINKEQNPTDKFTEPIGYVGRSFNICLHAQQKLRNQRALAIASSNITVIIRFVWPCYSQDLEREK